MSALPPVCILAGGLGTRLGERVREHAEAAARGRGRAVPVAPAAPARRHGAREVVLCVGYLGEQIERAHRRRAVRAAHPLQLRRGPDSDGTLGAIRRALPLLGERFLVLYGDTYLRIDYGAAATRGSRAACRR